MGQGWRAIRELLTSRNFALYIFSYHLMNIGKSMTFFAIWSQVTTMTDNSPTSLGLVTMLETLPGILIAPWAGLLADRMSKRLLLILCYLAQASVVALLFFSTELWQLYLLASLHSMAGAFSDPPHRAFLPLLVRPDQYVTMNAMMATLNNFFQLFRPALAGFIVASFGYKIGFAIDFFTYFLPAAALLLIRVRDKAEERDGSRQTNTAWQDVRAGLAYIRTEPILVYLFAFMMLFVLAMSMQGPLTFLFAGEYLSDGGDASRVAGMLFSTLGIGGIVGAFLTPRLLKKVPIFHLLFFALAFDGLVVCLFAMSNTLVVALICFALLGVVGSVNQIVQDTIIQTIVPEHLRGRVYGAFAPITGPISLISVGSGTWLASMIGVRLVFLIAGLMEIAVVIICRLLPNYGRVRRSVSEKIQRLQEG